MKDDSTQHKIYVRGKSYGEHVVGCDARAVMHAGIAN